MKALIYILSPFRAGVFSLLIICSLPAYAQIITTVAGGGTAGGTFGTGDGGPATDAILYNPYGLAIDRTGNIYIADRNNNRIRKINTSGIITTIAGTGSAGYTGDGGQATAAKIDYPIGVAADGAGNIYFTDRNNECIRKINTSGIITTIAGTTIAGYNGDGMPATSAQLNAPGGIKIDAAGNIYVSDAFNSRIRKINTAGIITTIAGTGRGGHAGDNGMATAAEIGYPYGIALDATGNIFFTDWAAECVRKINPSGIITTIAGIGTQGFSGDGAAATSAEFFRPVDLAVDAIGYIYISDAYNFRIRKVNSAGIISTIAGTGTAGFSGDGGFAISANLAGPSGIVLDSEGRIYFSDLGNNRIRSIVSSVLVPEVCSERNVLQLYPNPSNGLLTFKLSSNTNEPIHIIITNTIGEPINEIIATTNKPENIRLSAPAGIYLLTAITAEGRWSAKLMLEK